MNKPGQVVIDINGQMDDHNAIIPSDEPGGAMSGGNPPALSPPVHTIAFYANPIMENKPVVEDMTRTWTSNDEYLVRFIKAGDVVPTDRNFNTLVFGPGVHQIGHNFKIFPGKTYYIPGDAIVYGNMNNYNVSNGGFQSIGENIKIYGYGTINGMVTPHYKFRDNQYPDPYTGVQKTRPDNPEYPAWYATQNDTDEHGMGIGIKEILNTQIIGVTTADPANFNTHLMGTFRTKNSNVNTHGVRWAKFHSWRQNGDGCGAGIPIADTFFRTSDDCTYIRNTRVRCTFWKDVNANIFKISGDVAGSVEDSDILYARWKDISGTASVFRFMDINPPENGASPSKIFFRNIRFHDKLATPEYIFEFRENDPNIDATFEDMSIYRPINNAKSTIGGASDVGPFKGKLKFKNITFKDGLNANSAPISLNNLNYKDYFFNTPLVAASMFEAPHASTTVGPDGFSPLMRYALGASVPTGAFQVPVTSSTYTTLSITAVVRVYDVNLTVSAETNTDLTASGEWTSAGVTVADAIDQTNLPAGCIRKVFSVSTVSANRKFVRLKAVLSTP